MPRASGATSWFPFRDASLGECVASRTPRNNWAGAALPRPPDAAVMGTMPGLCQGRAGSHLGLITSHSCTGDGTRAQPWARQHGSSIPWQGGSSGGTSWLPAACSPWGVYCAGSLLPVGVGLDALPEVPASRNCSVMYSGPRGLPGMSQQPRSPLQNKLQSTAPEPPCALQGWLW